MARQFLKPSLRESITDPLQMLDMAVAVAAVADALTAGRSIAVFADYDVDGATSAAQIVRFGRALGFDIPVYVPDRLKEGYGPSIPAFDVLKSRGIDLVITVDCGAVARAPLVHAAAIGLDVVVLDHHMALGSLPPARAIVNPNRDGCPSGLGHLAAAGVTFHFLIALRAALRGTPMMADKEEPDLLALMGLVGLGTHCDMVPLIGVNRAFVAQGLKVLNGGDEPGIRALCDVAGLDGEITSQSLGFVIGPRINAGGRIGEADLGVRLLTSCDGDEIRTIAALLDRYNQERRAVESAVLDEASLQGQAQESQQVIIASGEGWHPGVVGIVAGRLKELFQKPAIVIGIDSIGGIARGSGRSVGGFNLGQAITCARQAGLLLTGGGHAMAAGLSMEPQGIAHLSAFLEREAYRFGHVEPEPLLIDDQISVAGLNAALAEELGLLGPYGMGHPMPLIAVMHARIGASSVVGENHLRVSLEGDGGARIQAMAFRALGTPLGNFVMRAGATAHIALTIEKGRGRFLNLVIDDVVPVQR
jgi:single-stranded-DNA-specific exonuclease